MNKNIFVLLLMIFCTPSLKDLQQYLRADCYRENTVLTVVEETRKYGATEKNGMITLIAMNGGIKKITERATGMAMAGTAIKITFFDPTICIIAIALMQS